MSLDAFEAKAKSEAEPFTFHRQQCSVLLDFWRWGFSNLMDNALRGALAEFIVGRALGILRADDVRSNWTNWDLETNNGLKIEVKASAHLQGWHQKKLSKITFSIAPTLAWNPTTNEFASTGKRHADIYVFCLLDERNKDSVDPLNLDQWKCFCRRNKNIESAVPEEKEFESTDLGNTLSVILGLHHT